MYGNLLFSKHLTSLRAKTLPVAFHPKGIQIEDETSLCDVWQISDLLVSQGVLDVILTLPLVNKSEICHKDVRLTNPRFVSQRFPNIWHLTLPDWRDIYTKGQDKSLICNRVTNQRFVLALCVERCFIFDLYTFGMFYSVRSDVWKGCQGFFYFPNIWHR